MTLESDYMTSMPASTIFQSARWTSLCPYLYHHHMHADIQTLGFNCSSDIPVISCLCYKCLDLPLQCPGSAWHNVGSVPVARVDTWHECQVIPHTCTFGHAHLCVCVRTCVRALTKFPSDLQATHGRASKQDHLKVAHHTLDDFLLL